MNPQGIAVLVCLGLALAYLGIRAVRTWRRSGCGGGCGCAKTTAKDRPTPLHELGIRRPS